MPYIIDQAQAGFTKGRSVKLNIQKALTTLKYAKQHRERDKILMALDAEKAFDNVNLSWLYKVMEKIGFEGTFLPFIKKYVFSTHCKNSNPRTYIGTSYTTPRYQAGMPSLTSPL